jgi:hypothetical protein
MGYPGLDAAAGKKQILLYAQDDKLCGGNFRVDPADGVCSAAVVACGDWG